MNKELYNLSYALQRQARNKVLFVIFVVLFVYVSVNLVLTFVIFPSKQTSVSMSLDIDRGTCIMFSPLIRHYQRGNVVLIKPRSPERRTISQTLFDTFVLFITGRQFSIDNISGLVGDSYQIRRVVGIPGDKIYMRDYVLYVKPRGEKYFFTEFELIKHSYKANINANPGGWDNAIGVTGSFEEMTLGDNEYFILADCRNSAIDSRLWGVLKSEDIKARALFSYFPLHKIRLFW